MIVTPAKTERRNDFSENNGRVLMGRLIKRRPEDFSADSVRVAAERSETDSGLHIAAGNGRPKRNREVPRKKRSRAGTSSIPIPQRERIKQHYVSGNNIS